MILIHHQLLLLLFFLTFTSNNHQHLKIFAQKQNETQITSSSSDSADDQKQLLLTYQIVTYVLAAVLGLVLIIIISLFIQFRLVASARQREAASLALSALACCRCFISPKYSSSLLAATAAGEKHPEQLEANARDPRRAPCDPFIQTTIIFLDVEAGSQLWEKCPAAMEHAMKSLTVLTRNAVCEYNAYEVKSMGDGWMIAIVSPVAAVTMLVDLLYKRNDNFDGLGNEDAAALKDAYGQIGPSSDAAVEKLYREKHSSSDDDDDDDDDDESFDPEEIDDDDSSSADAAGNLKDQKNGKQNLAKEEKKKKKTLSQQEIDERYRKHQEKMKQKKKNKKNGGGAGAVESAYLTAYTPASKLQRQQRDERKHKNTHTFQPGQQQQQQSSTLKHQNGNNHHQHQNGNSAANNYHHRSRYQQYLQQDVAILPSYNHQAYLRIRAGLDIGLVKILHQAETNEYDYSGLPVERASRLEKLAHGHQCLVSSQIVDAVKMMHGGTKLLKKIEFQFLDEIDAGGSTTENPLHVFQVNVRDSDNKQDDDFYIIYPPLRVARAREVDLDGNGEGAGEEQTQHQHLQNTSASASIDHQQHHHQLLLLSENSAATTGSAAGMPHHHHQDSEDVTMIMKKRKSPQNQQNNNYEELAPELILTDNNSNKHQQRQGTSSPVNQLLGDAMIIIDEIDDDNNNNNGAHSTAHEFVRSNSGNEIYVSHLEETNNTNNNFNNNGTSHHLGPSGGASTALRSSTSNNNNNNDIHTSLVPQLSVTPAATTIQNNNTTSAGDELHHFCVQFFFAALSTVPRDMRHKTLSALLLSWGVKVPQSIAGTGQNTRQAIAAMSAKKKAALQAQDSLDALAEMTTKVLKSMKISINSHHQHPNSFLLNNKSQNHPMISGIATAQSFHSAANQNQQNQQQNQPPNSLHSLVQQLQQQNQSLQRFSVGVVTPGNNNNNNNNNKGDSSGSGIHSNSKVGNRNSTAELHSSTGSVTQQNNMIIVMSNPYSQQQTHQNTNEGNSSNNISANTSGNFESKNALPGAMAITNNNNNLLSIPPINRITNNSSSSHGSSPTDRPTNGGSSVSGGGSFSNYQQRLAHQNKK